MIVATYPIVVTDKLHECRDFYTRWFGMSAIFEASWIVVLSSDGEAPTVAFVHPSHDPKVFCVPDGDPAWESLHDKDDIPDELRIEIAHFFDVYGELRGKKPSIEGWASRSEALEVIEAARDARRE